VAQLYPQALFPHFVASYDLQGYGGGIRPLLHTGMTWMTTAGLCNPRYTAPGRRTHRKHRSFLYANRFHGNVFRRPAAGCLPRIRGLSHGVVTLFRPRGNVPTEPPPSNGGPPRPPGALSQLEIIA
jgi:hypothetical protein